MSIVSKKVEDFFEKYPARKYQKGQILILNDDEPKTIYLLRSGSVKQYDISYRGEELVLNMYKPGAFFPMSYALNGGKSQYIFEANTDIEVRQAPSEDVVSFLSTNPDVLADLLARVYRGTDALLGRIVQLADGSAKTRLVYELVITAKRFGQQDGDKYTLQITEKELGTRAGLSREAVSRAMQKLKSEDLANLEDGCIIIKNLTKLEKSIE